MPIAVASSGDESFWRGWGSFSCENTDAHQNSGLTGQTTELFTLLRRQAKSLQLAFAYLVID